MEMSVGDKKLGERMIAGEFNETVVFHPQSEDDIVLTFRCREFKNTIKYIISKIPANIDEYIDVGVVKFDIPSKGNLEKSGTPN
jgi:hypothetical protein